MAVPLVNYNDETPSPGSTSPFHTAPKNNSFQQPSALEPNDVFAPSTLAADKDALPKNVQRAIAAPETTGKLTAGSFSSRNGASNQHRVSVLLHSDPSSSLSSTYEQESLLSSQQASTNQQFDQPLTFHVLERPYRAYYPVLPDSVLRAAGLSLNPPPYPPIIPGQALEEEQRLPIYHDPLVDLRRETFFPNHQPWRFLPPSDGVKIQKENKIASTFWESRTEAPKFPKAEIEARCVEGPKELPSGKKGRSIKRYRILDHQGREILLYVNLLDGLRRKTRALGEEVETLYRKGLSPYIPGTRDPPAPGPNRLYTVPSHIATFEALRHRPDEIRSGDSKRRKRRSPRLRFQPSGKPRHRETDHDSSYDDPYRRLHPWTIGPCCSLSCEPVATTCCNGVPCCCPACCYVPAVTLHELFCTKRKDEAATGFTVQGPVVGVIYPPARSL